jgi:hypothetical protein
MHAVTQAGEAWDYPQPFDNVTTNKSMAAMSGAWFRKKVFHP